MGAKVQGNWNGVSLAQTPPPDLCNLRIMVKLGQKLKRLCQALSGSLGLLISFKWRLPYRLAWDETMRATLPWTIDTSCATFCWELIRKGMRLAWLSGAEEWFHACFCPATIISPEAGLTWPGLSPRPVGVRGGASCHLIQKA